MDQATSSKIPDLPHAGAPLAAETLERFDALAPGQSFMLVAEDTPRSALRALQAERRDRFDWSVLEAGPRAWRIEVRRRDTEAPRGPDEYLTWDHRRLDAIVAAVRSLVDDAELPAAAARFDEFACGLEHHIGMEEQVLFPALEGRAPSSSGPTAVMRFEHVGIRRLLGAMSEELRAGDPVSFQRDDAELDDLLGAHNMKEERILYPMSDRAAGGEAERAALVGRLQST